MHKRRIVLRSIATVAAVSAAGIPLSAFALQKLDPKDPQAVSLGYTDNTETVDDNKYPKHEPSQTCNTCQFYQAAQQVGKLAPCAVFNGKAVSATGWCSAYTRKPA